MHSRDLLHAVAEGFNPIELARPVSIVHDALPAMQVIERLKASPGHMLFVYDEYGQFEGIIRPMDVLGAITGSFDETEVDEPKIVERAVGSLLVAGWMPVDEFCDRIGIDFLDDALFKTVAGLVLHRLAELPHVGQCITIGNWQIDSLQFSTRVDSAVRQLVRAENTEDVYEGRGVANSKRFVDLLHPLDKPARPFHQHVDQY